MPSPDETKEPKGLARVRLQSASFTHWPMPNAKAQFSASPERTVLVGRNGAGKSLLLEGLYWGARSAVALNSSRRATYAPQNFECELSVGDIDEPVIYESQIYLDTKDLLESEPSLHVRRLERCYLKQSKKDLWTVRDGIAHLQDASEVPVTRGAGFLAFDSTNIAKLPIAQSLQHFFHQAKRIESGLPRQGERNYELVTIEDGRVRFHAHHSRVERLAGRLVRAWIDKSDRLNEFKELCKRVGIASNVSIAVMKPPIRAEGVSNQEWALVQFDDTNVGQVSDGTLRTAEVLWVLLTLGESGLLVFEEPETGIHPGLLKRLLAVIDSYTIEHQVLISTHSLQVVNWARPTEIRLVERSENTTVARALTQTQLERLGEYLNDEGSLGDFVYGGGADD